MLGIVIIATIVVCVIGVNLSQQGDSARTNPAALSCDDSSVRIAASMKLADWITQNIVNGKVSAKLVVDIAFLVKMPSTDGSTFVSADGASSTINGDPQGAQRCRANFAIAFKEANGNLFGGYNPNSFTTEFLLASGPDGPQITLNDDEIRSATLDEVSAITGFEREREHLPRSTSQSAIAADPASSAPKSYTILKCLSDASGTDCNTPSPPAVYYDGDDCLTELAKLVTAGYELVDIDNVARIYRIGERSAWMQCYDTRQ
jgi:hypothetical protein